MRLQHKIFFKLGKVVRNINLAQFYSMKKEKKLETRFKLMFFSGKRDLDYLNSSLISIYKFWNEIPEVYIVSDGTPVEIIRNGLIKWPQKVDVFSWEQCAEHFKERGNNYLYDYASNVLIGKKLVGLLYCAEKSPIFYSDSDVLWFNPPSDQNVDFKLKPQMKMSQDIGYFYSINMLELLYEKKCLNTTPYNSGLIFLNGDFSSYPKWEDCCKFLSTNNEDGWFEEQTTFAILSNYFNPNVFFKPEEILIKIDDEFGIKYTAKQYPNILARHYVNKKSTTFWRDFLFMYFKKK